MTRTDLLSLAERLTFHGRYGGESPEAAASRRVNEREQAAALLRKLAELRPVAWTSLWGGLPVNSTISKALADDWRSNGGDVEGLYQLSEVLTDE